MTHCNRQAHDSGTQALKRSTDKLESYLHDVLSRCHYPLSTRVVERINNTIKVIKRRAYGYQGQDHCPLEVQAAFPGDERRTKKSRDWPGSRTPPQAKTKIVQV